MRAIAEIKAEIKTLVEYDARINYLQNEGCEGYNQRHPKLRGLYNELEAAMDAAFAADWTVETTQARRAAWNAEIAKVAKNGKIDAADVTKIVDRLGYRMEDIVKAKKLHGM